MELIARCALRRASTGNRQTVEVLDVAKTGLYISIDAQHIVEV